MKQIKKLASLLLALVMVLSMTVTGFAETTTTEKGKGEFTITLENDKSGHEYKAYQIFKGDLVVKQEGTTETKVLSNIEWGDGIDSNGLVAALKADETLNKDSAISKLPDDASAAMVAEALTEKGNDSEIIRAFADLVAGRVTSAAGTSTEQKGDNGKTTGYKISSLPAGYYLVKETTETVGDGDAYSRYMLEVVADVSAKVKAETPTVEKKIVEGNEKVDANHAGIGQVVSYEITGKVPDSTGYDKYFYVINDMLSEGLTFNDDITVTIAGKTLDLINGESENPDGDYYVYKGNKADGHTFQIAFKNIKDYDAKAEIIVTYSATVNANAVIGGTGNPNKVTLTYSNNPNSQEKGEKEDQPGKPDDKVPTGKSPQDVTVTYAAKIEITKTKEGGEVLPGAEFTLTGTSTQTVLTNKTYYEISEEGTYYLLKDGTYTEEKPQKEIKDDQGNITTNSNEDSYVNPTVTYVQKNVTETQEIEVPVKLVAVSGNDGKLTFGGLGAGVYTIEETGVPAGYNKAENITVEIACTVPETIADGTEEAEWSVGDQTTEVMIDGTEKPVAELIGSKYSAVYGTTIVNKTGAQLPSTGGIGTTIFYAAGIILMAGAVFFVIRRKRA
ncbi:MAG: isopeptide-forming domain-containing fimbrial protein [Lachnospiraceae bacterium]|nr:isopeptide-forming domain-containing fimbrial protein [Lachnospiraceae bacterium]